MKFTVLLGVFLSSALGQSAIPNADGNDLCASARSLIPAVRSDEQCMTMCAKLGGTEEKVREDPGFVKICSLNRRRLAVPSGANSRIFFPPGGGPGEPPGPLPTDAPATTTTAVTTTTTLTLGGQLGPPTISPGTHAPTTTTTTTTRTTTTTTTTTTTRTTTTPTTTTTTPTTTTTTTTTTTPTTTTTTTTTPTTPTTTTTTPTTTTTTPTTTTTTTPTSTTTTTTPTTTVTPTTTTTALTTTTTTPTTTTKSTTISSTTTGSTITTTSPTTRPVVGPSTTAPPATSHTVTSEGNIEATAGEESPGDTEPDKADDNYPILIGAAGAAGGAAILTAGALAYNRANNEPEGIDVEMENRRSSEAIRAPQEQRVEDLEYDFA